MQKVRISDLKVVPLRLPFGLVMLSLFLLQQSACTYGPMGFSAIQTSTSLDENKKPPHTEEPPPLNAAWNHPPDDPIAQILADLNNFPGNLLDPVDNILQLDILPDFFALTQLQDPNCKKIKQNIIMSNGLIEGIEVIITFNCPEIKGAVERKINFFAKNFAESIDLTHFSQLGTETIQSQMHNNIDLVKNTYLSNRKFSNIIAHGTNLRIKEGHQIAEFTPDNPGSTEPLSAGTLVFNGHFESQVNTQPRKVFDSHSNDVHIASCGPDKGSFNVDGDGHAYVLTFTGCNKRTLTDHGAPVDPPTQLAP